jgi:hypothetical protein
MTDPSEMGVAHTTGNRCKMPDHGSRVQYQLQGYHLLNGGEW